MRASVRVAFAAAVVGLFPVGSVMLSGLERATSRPIAADPVVTPKGGSTSAASNSVNNSVVFTVQNNTGQDQPFGLDCRHTGNVTTLPSCDKTKFIGAGMSINFTVKYDVGGGTTGGTVRLNAQGLEAGGPDEGWYDVAVTSYGVDVTAYNNGNYSPNPDPYDGGREAAFTIKNIGSATETYAVTCSATGQVTCTHTDSTTVTLAPNAQKDVVAYFNVKGIGVDTVLLNAIGGGVADTGRMAVSVTARYAVHVNGHRNNQPHQAYTAGVDTFFVKNTGEATATWDLTATCTTDITDCAASPTSVVLVPGATARVLVTFNTTVAGAWPRITLRADRNGGTEWHEGYQWPYTYGTNVPLFSRSDAELQGERARCLTVGLPGGGASQCGDLVLTHALPSTTVLNRPFTPVLIYNSLTAEPDRVPRAIMIERQHGTFVPDSVTMTARVGMSGALSGPWSYPGSDWSLSGELRRVTGYIDATAYPTGLYLSRVEVRNHYGATAPYQWYDDWFAVVNRDASPFGSGWWLAGWERLLDGSWSHKYLVGGDGSTRLFGPVTDSLWVSSAGAIQDSIWMIDDPVVRFVRRLRGGGSIQFNAAGQHIFTENRLGQKTEFMITNGRLNQIKLPGGAALTYDFQYLNGSNDVLSRVTAPSIGSTNRHTDVTVVSGRITQFQRPDNTTIGLGYGGSNRVASVTDPGGATASFSYDAMSKVAAAWLPVGADTIRVEIASHWSRTLNASLPVDAGALTQVFGARQFDSGPSGLANQETRYHIGHFGAPYRVISPTGDTTTIDLDDGQDFGLVTRVRQPSGWTVGMFYDSHGNLIRSVDSSTGATSLYAYDERWDAMSTQILPEGERIDIGYDASNGNRLWQQDSRGARATFEYFDWGDARDGLLFRVTSPLGAETSVDYDAMGNLKQINDPLNNTTNLFRDAVGRVVMTHTPIEGSEVRKDSTVYDVMGRSLETLSIGPGRSYQLGANQYTVPAETLFVHNQYDANGNVTNVTRYSAPDTAKVMTTMSAFGYDRANRRTYEDHGDGKHRSYYDANGNVIRTVSATGREITMQYDIRDQLIERITPSQTHSQTGCLDHGLSGPCGYVFPVFPNSGTDYVVPANTDEFSYDIMGNMVSATNQYASIHRTYNQNGSLATDRIQFREYGTGNLDANNDFAISHTYDLNGRRTATTHPSGLTGSGGTTQTYAYHPWGALQRVTNVFDNTYDFFYDLEGRPDSLAFPSGWETRSYDVAGRMTGRVERTTSLILHDATITYDAGGRIRTADALPGTQNGWTADMYYSGLGHLVGSEQHNHIGSQISREQFWPDAGGHQAIKGVVDGGFDPTWRTEYANGKLERVVAIQPSGVPATWRPDTTYNQFDGDGNATGAGHRKRVHDESGEGWVAFRAEARYYGAGQQLMASQVYRDSSGVGTSYAYHRGAWEEYWYDALGRRILVRRRADDARLCTGTTGNPCLSSIERFVWDGDQILYEIKKPGGAGANLNLAPTQASGDWKFYGWTGYTHGPGIDAPLDVMRHSYNGSEQVLIPHANWRGQYDSGTDVTGARLGCATYGQTGCADIQFPAHFRNAFHHDDSWWRDAPEWWGSLIQGKRDMSGLMYMRNRYYDPATGQFTQQDPIGLAGGLNLYGFAGGDPVNRTDPFGLCDDPKDPDCVSMGERVKGALRSTVRNAIDRTVKIGAGIVNGLRDALPGLAADVGVEAGLFVATGGGSTAKTSITASTRAMKHVLNRHAWWSRSGASRFAPGENILDLLRAAPDATITRQAVGRNMQRVVNAGRVIGTDMTRGHAPTSIYTVITTPSGALKTMFPGLPIP